jgi:hypothetical protein
MQQRYINAIFAILVGAVFVVGIYLIRYEDAGAPKAKQSQLSSVLVRLGQERGRALPHGNPLGHRRIIISS